MPVSVPFKGGEAGLYGTAAPGFLGFIIKRSGSFLNRAEAIDHARLKEKHFSQRSFAAAARAHQGVGALSFQIGHDPLLI